MRVQNCSYQKIIVIDFLIDLVRFSLLMRAVSRRAVDNQQSKPLFNCFSNRPTLCKEKNEDWGILNEWHKNHLHAKCFGICKQSTTKSSFQRRIFRQLKTRWKPVILCRYGRFSVIGITKSSWKGPDVRGWFEFFCAGRYCYISHPSDGKYLFLEN